MQIQSQIINIIHDKLKNPIYQTIQLLNMKTILTKSNFTKKEGATVHMVVIVKINYFAEIVYIKFIGTHKQYDKIKIEEL